MKLCDLTFELTPTTSLEDCLSELRDDADPVVMTGTEMRLILAELIRLRKQVENLEALFRPIG
jgi:hypothetical protein